MAHMSTNQEIPRINDGNSSQLKMFILDSGATCLMTPEISYFILCSLVQTDKYIEVEDWHFFTAKPTLEVQIKIRYDNGKQFIATLYKVLLATDLRD